MKYEEKVRAMEIALKNLDPSDLVQIYNSICQDEQNIREMIHSMDDFDDVYRDYSPSEMAVLIQHSINRFDIRDDYFKMDFYDDAPESSDEVIDLMELPYMADYILTYGCPIDDEDVNWILCQDIDF